jgi:hypothetical protein
MAGVPLATKLSSSSNGHGLSQRLRKHQLMPSKFDEEMFVVLSLYAQGSLFADPMAASFVLTTMRLFY